MFEFVSSAGTGCSIRIALLSIRSLSVQAGVLWTRPLTDICSIATCMSTIQCSSVCSCLAWYVLAPLIPGKYCLMKPSAVGRDHSAGAGEKEAKIVVSDTASLHAVLVESMESDGRHGS